MLCKLSLTNVITPMATDKKEWFIASNRISKSYFDFVIFDPRTLESRVVIDVDDGKE